MKAPKSKKEMYPLYLAGHFGNKLVTWGTVEEYERALVAGEWDDSKPVVLRYKGTPGVNPPRYGEAIPANEASDVARMWVTDYGFDANLVTVNELAMDTKLRLQGEVGYFDDLLHMRYTDVKKPMRPALIERSVNARGATARVILIHYLDEHSYENLMWLLDKYDAGTVVEFSAYDCPVGNLGWNTVFWEIRSY